MWRGEVVRVFRNWGFHVEGWWMIRVLREYIRGNRGFTWRGFRELRNFGLHVGFRWMAYMDDLGTQSVY